MVDWSQLPEDIVYIIADKIVEVRDHVVFRSVCKSWFMAPAGYVYRVGTSFIRIPTRPAYNFAVGTWSIKIPMTSYILLDLVDKVNPIYKASIIKIECEVQPKCVCGVCCDC